MELVQGEDLATLLRRVGRLPSEKVVDIGRQLCAGLAAAHAQGVLHRDLKPANVLIDQDGSVRITDFGIAIARRRDRPTRLGGTPGYMAPEQLRAGRVAVGADRPVRAGRDAVRAARRVRPVHDRSSRGALPPRPSTLVPDVDPQLERVILQALAPDPRIVRRRRRRWPPACRTGAAASGTGAGSGRGSAAAALAALVIASLAVAVVVVRLAAERARSPTRTRSSSPIS